MMTTLGHEIENWSEGFVKTPEQQGRWFARSVKANFARLAASNVFALPARRKLRANFVSHRLFGSYLPRECFGAVR